VNGESVAIDVASHLNNQTPNVGQLADLGLSSFDLYGAAYNASESLGEYIVAGTACGKECDTLIMSTLKAIYTAPAGWTGNEILSAALMVLRIVASIPDDRQRDRISFMMQTNERPAAHIENGVGLLVAARSFYGTRPTQHYPNEIHYAFDRYVGILKELLGLHGIYSWMTENRAQWAWMERDLLENHHQVAPQPVQGDYSARRENDGSGIPLDHHNHSDSDMPGINDSEEEDDDDSRFEEMETYQEGPARILVEGAGHPAVNGMYARDGYFERACKYSRQGEYNGEACLFSLFQCNVSNNTKHWYISIVPGNGQPGTSADVDFYSAPVTDTCSELPPMGGWTKSNEGRDPSPALSFKDLKVEEVQLDGRVDQGYKPGVEDDENQGRGYHV
jgi:ubiquitin carboxyl-terminal hydrolase 9/24